jgi:3-oxoacyl-[acyl-carrier protein] reductase
MLLENKNAVIYGAGGSIGGAVARAFAREGATVFLAGRTLATLEEVAEEIRAAGGEAETAQVDALDEEVVEEHAKTVAEKIGGIDIFFNAIFNDDVQGQPLAEIPFEDFARPITKAMRNQFLTTRAVARHMVEQGSGVILTITGGYREAFPTIGGTVVAWAAIEAQCRQWACELGPQGVRVVWLRTTGLPEAIPDTGDAAADLGTGYGGGHDARRDHRRDAGADHTEKAGLAGRARQGRGLHGLGSSRHHDRYLRQYHLRRNPRLVSVSITATPEKRTP